MSIGICDQLHEQYAVEETKRLRHPNSGRHKPVQRVDFGVFPDSLLFLAAVACALRHGPGLATAADLSPLLILRTLLKATLRHVLVDLGTANLRPGTYDVDSRFLTAFELTDHFVDDAVIQQRLQSFGCSHRLSQQGNRKGPLPYTV